MFETVLLICENILNIMYCYNYKVSIRVIVALTCEAPSDCERLPRGIKFQSVL